MILAAIRRLPNAEAILARVPPESIATLEHCHGTSWVPARPYDELAEALLAEVGLPGMSSFFESQASRWSDSKLLGQIFKAGNASSASPPSVS
jgi:hypothetical protein